MKKSIIFATCAVLVISAVLITAGCIGDSSGPENFIVGSWESNSPIHVDSAGSYYEVYDFKKDGTGTDNLYLLEKDKIIESYPIEWKFNSSATNHGEFIDIYSYEIDYSKAMEDPKFGGTDRYEVLSYIGTKQEDGTLNNTYLAGRYMEYKLTEFNNSVWP